jgi:hypothetical protein
VFWKKYIDYALWWAPNSSSSLYGLGDSWSAAGRSIFTGALAPYAFPWDTPPGQKPYLRYTDSPNRPRLHFWFGPLSMMDFIANANANWKPGTCHEAQCWQLKAGMNSALGDVQNNHPNDLVGLTMFAYSFASPIYQNPRVATGQNFTPLKNALFYPKTLLPLINGGDTTTEERPYDATFTSVAGDEIPNANGGTDPCTGLAIAFNLLSPSSQLDATQYGSVRGRRGASKLIIFETDGVPDSHTTSNFNQRGYDSYYSNFANSGVGDGNGQPAATNPAIAVTQQIVKRMAGSNGVGLDSGLSLPNAPAVVYPIAFGDLFDPVASPGAIYRPSALQFLANVAAAGNSGPAGATTLDPSQIITGSYTNRINTLKSCLERIFQSGVSVTLIE